ncbi:phosphatase PAP2 family protein [Porphyromonadaceae bacterium W3.11]|nr:phosphatase PAP2 family protein [Porphyromonadaceae bacterium W3.11]
MVESLVGWEKDFFLFLNSPHTPYLDGVMYLISAPLPWIIVLIPFFILFSYKKDYREFLLLLLFIGLLVFMADSLSSGIIKPLFQRYRPTHHPETLDAVKTVLNYRGGNYGFISGHSTNFLAFATFSSLVIRNRWYTILIFITTLTVAYSRIYLGVHFVTDVIPGILCGMLIGVFLYWLYREARSAFFSMTLQEATVPYIKGRERIFAILIGAFYFSLWVLSPLVIQLYR